jgi:hypothetical protein
LLCVELTQYTPVSLELFSPYQEELRQMTKFIFPVKSIFPIVFNIGWHYLCKYLGLEPICLNTYSIWLFSEFIKIRFCVCAFFAESFIRVLEFLGMGGLFNLIWNDVFCFIPNEIAMFLEDEFLWNLILYLISFSVNLLIWLSFSVSLTFVHT